MRFPSNRTLAKIAVYGAIASISGVMYMRHKMEERIRKSEHFQLALQTLRKSDGAIKLLGEPIKDVGFDLGDARNQCDAIQAHFEVRVKGSKDRGKMYFWASNKLEEGWLVDRLDLEVESQPDKRFLVKKPSASAFAANHAYSTALDEGLTLES